MTWQHFFGRLDLNGYTGITYDSADFNAGIGAPIRQFLFRMRVVQPGFLRVLQIKIVKKNYGVNCQEACCLTRWLKWGKLRILYCEKLRQFVVVDVYLELLFFLTIVKKRICIGANSLYGIYGWCYEDGWKVLSLVITYKLINENRRFEFICLERE